MALNDAPLSPDEARLKNSLSLAYLGDTVWDLLVRQELLHTEAHANALHRRAVEMVNAGAQAAAADIIEPLLTEEETAVFQRGRNAHAKHNTPKNQDPVAYSRATGLEALLGWLWLVGREDRILQLYESAKGK